jgi:hypothetical protein|uniref:Uncharacterized protein n=1 Tax=Panagrolaimus sp. PS1159 TaxID=55785 RepID=A0AC35F9P9_9BILA
MQNNFSIIPGFNQEPQSDGRNLAALFGEDETNEQQILNDLDFRYDPSSLHDPESIAPKPRTRRYSGNGTSEISLGDPIPVDFAEYKIHTVYLSVVNGEVLRFDDCEDGSMLCSISFSSFHLTTIGNAIAICIGNEIHSRFMGDSELYTKLCALISARHILEPLIFSFGEGEEEIQENSHVLFSQLSFCFSNNELKVMKEDTTDSKHLKMKAKRFEDPFLKHFKGKRAGAKFIVAIDGIGSCFEIKKVKIKTSQANDLISVTSDSSRQITPPLIINEIPKEEENEEEQIPRQILSSSSTLQTRMSKMGGIQLLPVEIVQPKPQEKEVAVEEEIAQAPELPPRTLLLSPPSAEFPKPIPAERKTSNFPETTTNYESLEKRIVELETKVEKLSTNQSPSTSTATTTSIPPQSKTDKYEFAMDLWAQIAASNSIPTEVKPEIKKIILSAAFQP